MEGDGQQRPLSAPSLPGRGFLNGAPILVAQKVCVSVYKGITTGEIGGLAADIAAAMTTSHPDYASLAARIAVSNLHKNTLTSFSATVKAL